MRSARLAFALAAAFGLVVPAWAATFSSPLLTAPPGGQGQYRISNVGKSSIDVSVTFYDGFGNVAAPMFDGCTALYAGALPAGVTCIATIGQRLALCRRCVVE